MAAVRAVAAVTINSDFRVRNNYPCLMKIKIHEFRILVSQLADGSLEERGPYVVSKAVLTIPEHLLNQQAVVETLPEGVEGISECCSRIYVNGSSWLVLGDVRSLCFTNDMLVVKY